MIVAKKLKFGNQVCNNKLYLFANFQLTSSSNVGWQKNCIRIEIFWKRTVFWKYFHFFVEFLNFYLIN